MEAGALKSVAVISLVFIMFSSLGTSVSSAQENTRVLDFQRLDPRLRDYGFASEPALWADPIVEVCWENPTEDTKAARLLVEEAVEQSWPHFAHLAFTGWSEACSP